MHNITLSEYLSRIEQLLAENRLPEAAAHCRYILKQYPRHVETYRLFGRVLLEQQQYDEAIDLFSRVTSADPEDLIAHAGLSLCYKEKLDLPKATWHMERAFEIDPFNRAVRDELIEFYAVRDGFRRHKLEITRPALARLYMRGTLYSKAVAELNRLLEEQPDRYDLRILLAEAMFWDERSAEAAEISRGLVDKMPYCIKANAILALAWMGNDRSDDSREYLQRLESLTLLTASKIDPSTTIGRTLTESGHLTFPEKVLVEALDDVAASVADSAVGTEWPSKVKVTSTDEEMMPGWLQEIGFTDMDSSDNEESAIPDVEIEPGELEGFDLDDWEEVEIADEPGAETRQEDLLAAELLALVETTETLTNFNDAIEEDIDSDVNLSEWIVASEMDMSVEDEIADQDVSFPPGSEHEPLNQDVPVEERDVEFEHWEESSRDFGSLVDDLQAQRIETTFLELESAGMEDPKGDDWLGELASGSEVSEDLPEWLYESVGFTGELVNASDEEQLTTPEEEPALPDDLTNNESVGTTSSKPAQDDVTNISHSVYELEGQQPISSTMSDSGHVEEDLPSWLLDAKEVLEELPEEILDPADDSWLSDFMDESDNVDWLEELRAGQASPSDSSEIDWNVAFNDEEISLGEDDTGETSQPGKQTDAED